MAHDGKNKKNDNSDVNDKQEYRRNTMQYKVSGERLPKGFELTEEFVDLFQLIENDSKNVFITGKAGTGKSTFLEFFRCNTRKQVAYVAPTAIAARNIGGRTLHSFFRIPPRLLVREYLTKQNYKPQSLHEFRNLDAFVIDEVSMLRADILDAIDCLLREKRGKNKPFGGVQMIFIGDVFQLPPVVNSQKTIQVQDGSNEYISEVDYLTEEYGGCFFFHAPSYKEANFAFVELQQIFRQKDAEFIRILNALRNQNMSGQDVGRLNQCYRPDNTTPLNHANFTTLCGDNATVNGINTDQLNRIDAKEYTYRAYMTGKYKDNSQETKYPAEAELVLKEGGLVMMIKNDLAKRWLNGTIASVGKLDNNFVEVIIDGRRYSVDRETWEETEYKYDKMKKSIVPYVVGTFEQYPIKLAWAVTIHKSQGQTFDKIAIDMEQGEFAHGQTYVALSRCTSLDGIVLRQPFKIEEIMWDDQVLEFYHKAKQKQEEEAIEEAKRKQEEDMKRIAEEAMRKQEEEDIKRIAEETRRRQKEESKQRAAEEAEQREKWGIAPHYRSICANLFVAVKEGNVSDVHWFLESGENINVENTQGNTPLHLAAKFNSAKIVEYLVFCGANINAKNAINQTPLDIAGTEEKKRILCGLMEQSKLS
jgi:hypothetical protein